MDGLALLCNLDADGPLSLRRLRESGVDDLEDLGRQPDASLAAVLKASPSQVRRFRHEGRLLARRLQELPLESDFREDTPIPGDVRARLLKQIVRPPVAYDLSPPDEDEPYQHEPDHPEPTEELRADEIDAVETPTEAETGPTLFEAASTLASAPATPSREPAPLKIGEIPGLDSRTCQQLVAQGVRTYQALVDLANLNLARRTGIPFTRLLDLRHHARGVLQSRVTPSVQRPAAPEPEVELVPQPRWVVTPPAVRVEPLLRDPMEAARPRATSAFPSPDPPRSPGVEAVVPGVEAPPSRTGEMEEPGVAGPFV